MDINGIEVDEFTLGYLEAMFFTEDEELGQDTTIYTIDNNTLTRIVADCAKFQAENSHLLAFAGADDYNGHDFWLSRNGHGAGFFDRGYGSAGQKLHQAAKVYREFYVYLGDDNLVHA